MRQEESGGDLADGSGEVLTTWGSLGTLCHPYCRPKTHARPSPLSPLSCSPSRATCLDACLRVRVFVCVCRARGGGNLDSMIGRGAPLASDRVHPTSCAIVRGRPPPWKAGTDMEKIWPLVAVGCSLGVADGDGVCQWGRGGGSCSGVRIGVTPEYERIGVTAVLQSTNRSSGVGSTMV